MPRPASGVRRRALSGGRTASRCDGPASVPRRMPDSADEWRRRPPAALTADPPRALAVWRLQNARMTETLTVPAGLFPTTTACCAASGAAPAPEYRALPRRGMGLSRHRRAPPVREDLPGGLPGRPELAHHPQQARGVPQGLRQLRGRARSCASATPTSSACWPTPASCAIAARSSRPSTTRSACSSCAQEFGSLAAYAWRFEPEADTRPHTPQTGVVLGPSAEAVAMSKDLKKRGWSFVGPDDRVRVHAGDGAGQRPLRRLPCARAGVQGAQEAQEAGLSEAPSDRRCLDRDRDASRSRRPLSPRWPPRAAARASAPACSPNQSRHARLNELCSR